MLLWIDKEMNWLALGRGKRGRAETFSDTAIQFCLMVKNLWLSVKTNQWHDWQFIEVIRPGLADTWLHDTVSPPTTFAGMHLLSR